MAGGRLLLVHGLGRAEGRRLVELGQSHETWLHLQLRSFAQDRCCTGSRSQHFNPRPHASASHPEGRQCRGVRRVVWERGNQRSLKFLFTRQLNKSLANRLIGSLITSRGAHRCADTDEPARHRVHKVVGLSLQRDDARVDGDAGGAALRVLGHDAGPHLHLLPHLQHSLRRIPRVPIRGL